MTILESPVNATNSYKFHVICSDIIYIYLSRYFKILESPVNATNSYKFQWSEKIKLKK